MAGSFKEALKHTLRHEGGYVDDPSDAGGETYRGISRRYHPRWHGWDLIDGQRKSVGTIDDVLLEPHVAHFYRQNYWDRFQGDRLPTGRISVYVMLIAVHLGVHRAVEFVQRALNVLNLNGKSWNDVPVDGQCGNMTTEALFECLLRGRDTMLERLLVAQHAFYCMERMEQRPVNEKYVGWFNRMDIEGD